MATVELAITFARTIIDGQTVIQSLQILTLLTRHQPSLTKTNGPTSCLGNTHVGDNKSYYYSISLLILEIAVLVPILVLQLPSISSEVVEAVRLGPFWAYDIHITQFFAPDGSVALANVRSVEP